MAGINHNFSMNETIASVIWCAMVDCKIKLTSIIQQSDKISDQYIVNTDHRFILQASTLRIAQKFKTTWRVDSVYDFEPFSKGDITHLELADKLTLKLPDGLSHYLTKIGVANSFKHYSEWVEDWV